MYSDYNLNAFIDIIDLIIQYQNILVSNYANIFMRNLVPGLPKIKK